MLVIRGPGNARVVDLEVCMREAFGSLFSVTSDDSASQHDLSNRYTRRVAQGRLRSETSDTKEEDVSGTDRRHLASTEPANGLHLSYAANDENWAQKIRAMEGMYVRLTHSLVQEHLQDTKIQEGLSIFKTHSMRASLLLWCLKCVCDADEHPPDAIKTANAYCGVFLPEQFLDMDLSSVEPKTKLTIARYLLRLLREHETIDRWIALAQNFMVQDLLENEAFCKHAESWFRDPDVESMLKSEDPEWYAEFFEEPSRLILQGVAIGCLRRWLNVRTPLDETFWFLNLYLRKVRDRKAIWIAILSRY